MIRHRWKSEESISPSHQESLRQRSSFPSRKPKFFAKNGGISKIFSTKNAFIAFGCVAVVFLVAVHGYLFRVLWQSNAAVAGQSETTQAFQPPNDLHPQIGGTLRGGERQSTVQKRELSPLRTIDFEQYTVRINTWRRPEQLVVSVDHHASCPGVAQVQVVWCDKENEPPLELANYSNVIIERHEENSLNERFNILPSSMTPTLGILSIDDDVLRPCEAIDAGFFKWTNSPDRMVGFDARTHVENDDGSWQYGYKSTTDKTNKYSMSLTRYCFIHRDYMDWYMRYLPETMLNHIAQNFNCEDIAMSFLISSMTNGKPSLLADYWSINSMIKLYVQKKISGTKNHKSLRDQCVDSFADLLGLKDGPKRLQMAPFVHKKNRLFDCGAEPDRLDVPHQKPTRQVELESKIKLWRSGNTKEMQKDMKYFKIKAAHGAYEQGLIEKTSIWEQRFQTNITKG